MIKINEWILMIANYFYSQNAWVMFFSVLMAFVAFSMLGLFVSIKLIPKIVREKHTELVSYGLATISIFSAVLLAFIAITAWESYGKAESATSQEAQLVADVLRSSFAMPEPLRSQMIDGGTQYLDIVIKEEWPSMADQTMNFKRGRDELVMLYINVSKFRTSDAILQIQYANLYEKINNLIDARRSRILLAHQHFQPIVWGVVLIGALMNIVFLFLLSMESVKLHIAITSLIAIVIGCIFALIICFDRPFQGGLAISPDAFNNVKNSFLEYQNKY
jgi:hypothetical protein